MSDNHIEKAPKVKRESDMAVKSVAGDLWGSTMQVSHVCSWGAPCAYSNAICPGELQKEDSSWCANERSLFFLASV